MTCDCAAGAGDWPNETKALLHKMAITPWNVLVKNLRRCVFMIFAFRLSA